MQGIRHWKCRQRPRNQARDCWEARSSITAFYAEADLLRLHSLCHNQRKPLINNGAGVGVDSLELFSSQAAAPVFYVRPRKIPFSDLIGMGRIPVPTEILDARGSFLKHPERRRPNEPQEARPLGNAPMCLTPEQKKLWREIARNLPPGVGKISDRYAFEILVRLLAKERADSINNNERGQLIKLLGSFGMTPADRSKVSIDSTALDELQQYLIKPKPVRPTPAMNSKPAEAIQ
jgi:hypothetical protein